MKKNRIARILVASALLTLSVAATSFAAKGDKEVDLGIGFATEPASGFGTGLGLSVGGGLELLDISAIKGSTLQIRGDIGYNSWKYNFSGPGIVNSFDLKYSRIPVSAGARLYVPIEAVKTLRVYGEANLELSFDSIDVPVFDFFNGARNNSTSETNVGLSPAVGAEFAVTPKILVGGGLKYHIIDNSYLNATVGVGYKF